MRRASGRPPSCSTPGSSGRDTVNSEDWVELRHFDPVGDLQAIWEPLQLRVFATDDDGCYAFVAKKDELRHVAYRAPQGWVCPCGLGGRCPSALVMRVVSFPWEAKVPA